MIFTQKTKYGIQAALYMVINEEEACFSTKHISKEMGISYSYLTKIVKELSDAGILKTTRGKGGGLRLAKPARQISLKNILLALENSEYFDTCMRGFSVCEPGDVCVCSDTLREIDKRIYEFLESSTLQDLAHGNHVDHMRLSKALTLAM